MEPASYATHAAAAKLPYKRGRPRSVIGQEKCACPYYAQVRQERVDQGYPTTASSRRQGREGSDDVAFWDWFGGARSYVRSNR
jgi:hypothetical protein